MSADVEELARRFWEAHHLSQSSNRADRLRVSGWDGDHYNVGSETSDRLESPDTRDEMALALFGAATLPQDTNFAIVYVLGWVQDLHDVSFIDRMAGPGIADHIVSSMRREWSLHA
jgi:hypothetical protein